MKVIVRTVVLLAVVIWIGGVMFFPIVAADAFRSVADTHTAGAIVGKCIHDLHYEGIWTGVALLILLYAARKFRALPRSVLPPAIVTLVLLALTVFSQFWIIPRMDQDRIAAGGAINMVAPDNPNRVSFNKLHGISEILEAGIGAGGIVLIALLAANFPVEGRQV